MQQRHSKKQISFVHGVSGFFASMLATSMFFPLQTIQIHLEAIKNPRLQSISRFKDASSFIYTQQIAKKLGFRGNFIAINFIQGLYNGISFYLIGCALSNSVYFYRHQNIFLLIFQSEQFIKESLKMTNIKVWKQAEIQFCAAICNIFITAPIWTVNTKMNLSKVFIILTKFAHQENKTFLQTFHSMVKNQGFLSLYNGVPASLFLTINPMISNTLYHTIHDKSKIKIPTLIAGAISKTVATLITFPYLVIRTNLQVINNFINYFQEQIIREINSQCDQ